LHIKKSSYHTIKSHQGKQGRSSIKEQRARSIKEEQEAKKNMQLLFFLPSATTHQKKKVGASSCRTYATRGPSRKRESPPMFFFEKGKTLEKPFFEKKPFKNKRLIF